MKNKLNENNIINISIRESFESDNSEITVGMFEKDFTLRFSHHKKEDWMAYSRSKDFNVFVKKSDHDGRISMFSTVDGNKLIDELKRIMRNENS